MPASSMIDEINETTLNAALSDVAALEALAKSTYGGGDKSAAYHGAGRVHSCRVYHQWAGVFGGAADDSLAGKVRARRKKA